MPLCLKKPPSRIAMPHGTPLLQVLFVLIASAPGSVVACFLLRQWQFACCILVASVAPSGASEQSGPTWCRDRGVFLNDETCAPSVLGGCGQVDAPRANHTPAVDAVRRID